MFLLRLLKLVGNRWEYVNGLLLNVIYGGRVDNSFDLRILRSYLVQYFSDDSLGKQQSAIDQEIVVPLSADLRVSNSTVKRFVTKSTLCLVSSHLGLFGDRSKITRNRQVILFRAATKY